MTETIIVPLNKLDVDPKNVRKTYRADGIIELAASIKADGILQDPVVRKGDKKGRYFVTAGGRRLAALNALAESGDIAKDAPIQCKLKDGNAEAISLAENVMREGMSAADQFLAYTKMADDGMSIAEIAARFGTTETMVRKRLALGRVSPVLMDLYRDEKMSLDQLSAFTITDDHEAQERVWNDLPSYNRHASYIREALTGEGVRATDKRVRFLGGLDAYEAAGGSVKRDLFDEDGGYALDVVMLDSLVAQRLEAEAETVRAEGWKWVEITSDLPYDAFHSYGRRYPKPVDLGEEEQAEFDKLTAEYDELAELLNADAADEDAEPRLDAIEERLEQLRNRAEAYEPDAFEIGGAIITLANGGAIRIERGLVRPEDQPKRGTAKAQDSDDSEAESGKPKINHSAALIEDLTAQKTAALRIELANNPDIALAAVVHAMLSRVVGSGYGVHSALQISVTCEHIEGSMKQPDASKALAELESMRENWGHKIPGNPADLWEWCLDQTRDDLLVLLAFAAAHSVNAVEGKYSGDRKDAFAHANQLGQALNVDMTTWFEPTGAAYFSHINKQSIEAVIAEVKGAEAATSIRAAGKKAEAVAVAERMVANTGWLPEPVRIPAADNDMPAEFPEAAE
ncbi:ParB/RepB/Spo0J family partition protein [Sinorhizobium meliloti]|uniref:ParB/RepB/Spo0J family partition protein n=1 Tax=Rhizobium meliloti TaxID=382 RepID=UPI000FD93416|nr:ParB/RepB/Spo0J family partition protein [Sinorhizobium meliloti]RVL99765.1 ParB/RepB/Spo0J family partition protein [Sinorhizobium meliloti]RVO18471.1 ParB/RepB/Spo0J family partition protein [Sinorhizobium meliloti]